MRDKPLFQNYYQETITGLKQGIEDNIQTYVRNYKYLKYYKYFYVNAGSCIGNVRYYKPLEYKGTFITWGGIKKKCSIYFSLRSGRYTFHRGQGGKRCIMPIDEALMEYFDESEREVQKYLPKDVLSIVMEYYAFSQIHEMYLNMNV